MAELAHRVWSVDAFFAWQETQDDRFELVDGLPLRMMAGASNRHNRVANNIQGQLYLQLRGSGCRHFTGDGSVQTKRGQIRRPDVGVDCGPFNPDGYAASQPVMVAEVLSPTTRDFDTFRKAEEYKLIESLRRILLVDPNRAEVTMWSRADGGDWAYGVVAGLEAVIAMPEISVNLAMSDIYDGIVLPPELNVALGE